MVEDHGLLFDGWAAVGKAPCLIHRCPLSRLCCHLQPALKRLEDSTQQKQVEADNHIPQDWVFTISPHFPGRGRSPPSQSWSAKSEEDLGTQKQKGMVGVRIETMPSTERQILLGSHVDTHGADLTHMQSCWLWWSLNQP